MTSKPQAPGIGEVFFCPECNFATPHFHGYMTGPSGDPVWATIQIPLDPRAEIKDPESGEVIFPAVKGPLRVIEGAKLNTIPALNPESGLVTDIGGGDG